MGFLWTSYCVRIDCGLSYFPQRPPYFMNHIDEDNPVCICGRKFYEHDEHGKIWEGYIQLCPGFFPKEKVQTENSSQPRPSREKPLATSRDWYFFCANCADPVNFKKRMVEYMSKLSVCSEDCRKAVELEYSK
jgi:hypothetical protein